MEKCDIKSKAWNDVSKYNNLDDDSFDNCAISFKISDNHNLVVWCDTEHNCDVPFKYYIVSIRLNPYNGSFGEDIGAEYSTNDISKEGLEEAIEYVLSHKEFI